MIAIPEVSAISSCLLVVSMNFEPVANHSPAVKWASGEGWPVGGPWYLYTAPSSWSGPLTSLLPQRRSVPPRERLPTTQLHHNHKQTLQQRAPPALLVSNSTSFCETQSSLPTPFCASRSFISAAATVINFPRLSSLDRQNARRGESINTPGTI